jgi:hypothetical protein
MPLSHARRDHPARCLGARSLWIAGTCLLLPTIAAASEPSSTLTALDEALSEVQLLLSEAHFLSGLGVAQSTSRWAQGLPTSDDVLERRALLQVMIATAQVALGEHDSARESLRGAVDLDPWLVLPEKTTSPKLVRIFRQLHADSAPDPGPAGRQERTSKEARQARQERREGDPPQ